MGKVIKKICAMILICSLFILCKENSLVFASEKVTNIDILVRNKGDLEYVSRKLSGINSQIEVTEIPEIGLLRVQGINTNELYHILSAPEIADKISHTGNLATIEQDPQLLSNEDKNIISRSYSKSRSGEVLSNEELFDELAWHVDLVTNERNSLEKATGQGVKIAVIDSGIDKDHPILIDKVDLSNAESFVENDSDIKDTNGHGTMVSGIIAQISPDATITPYRVISESSGDSLWSIQAIIEAVNDGNEVINMSLGTYKDLDVEDEMLTVEAFERAIEYASENKVPIVASSGNNALNLDDYYETDHIKHLPGGMSGVITVSSVHNNLLASYSNYGTNIMLSAPGGDLVFVDGMLDLRNWIYCICPTYMDNGLSSVGIPQGYTYSYGTSLSAPQVTAGIADVIEYYALQGEERMDAVSYLENSAEDIGTIGVDIEFGYGMLDVDAALGD